MIEIWHNPSCSKSRGAASALREAGVEHVVRRYLDHPPTAAEIEAVLERLGLEPWEITRTADARTLDVALPAKDASERAAWIAALAAHPRLIQRPILLADDGTAVVGRDPESLARVIEAG